MYSNCDGRCPELRYGTRATNLTLSKEIIDQIVVSVFLDNFVLIEVFQDALHDIAKFIVETKN